MRARDIVLAITLGLVTNALSSLLVDNVAAIIIGIIVSIIAIFFNNIITGLRQNFKNLRTSFYNPFSRNIPFSELFDFHQEEVKIVYTCRSRIDKVPCPTYDSKDQKILLNAAYTHIPVDELFTVQLLTYWYKNLLQAPGRSEITKSFVCSHELERFESLLGQSEGEWRRSNLPDFMFGNLIIVGENGCSNMILERIQPHLNFYPRFLKVSDYVSGATVRPRIDLAFTDNQYNQILSQDRQRLITDFGPDPGNAVGAIWYVPNPFNIRKKVLILYGCHRVGQYLLQDWLYDSKTPAIFRRILALKKRNSSLVGQIVLNSPFTIKKGEKEGYYFSDTKPIKNKANNLPLFPLSVKSITAKDLCFKRDERAVKQLPMIDISLVIDIQRHYLDAAAKIDNFFKTNLPFLQGHYWESQAVDTGLHVTLLEFATHASDQSLIQGLEHFSQLRDAISQAVKIEKPLQLSLIGVEVSSSSIILYADLPISFIGNLHQLEKDRHFKNSYFNRMRVPFPLHCTIIRFDKDFSLKEQDILRNFADKFHRYPFVEFEVQHLSLLLTRKQPYQDVVKRFDWQLVADLAK